MDEREECFSCEDCGEGYWGKQSAFDHLRYVDGRMVCKNSCRPHTCLGCGRPAVSDTKYCNACRSRLGRLAQH